LAGKVLIADSLASNRILVRARLEAAHYLASTAATGREALAALHKDSPDLVILASDLPDMQGTDICRQIRSDPATREVAVIMVIPDDDPGRRVAALEAGADEVYARPLDDLLLQARIRSLMRSGEMQAQLGLREGSVRELGFAERMEDFRAPGLVGVIAECPAAAQKFARTLQPLMPDRIIAMDRTRVLAENGGRANADAFVICGDPADPGAALRLLSDLRARTATRSAAVCLVLPESGSGLFATAHDLGASDLIRDTASPQEAALRIAAQLGRKRRADRFRSTVAAGLRLAVIDPLTGLFNRRYGLTHLARLVECARTGNRPFAVLLLDLDRFKSVNDGWGHAVGDLVLKEVASRLKTCLRPSDMIARIGGEEFLVVLSDAGGREAQATAERLRRIVSDRPVALVDGQALTVTLSIGLALDDPAAPSCDDLVNRADRALLASKAEGRNQVTVDRTAA
jgi:two-component system cell cycle response regulator